MTPLVDIRRWASIHLRPSSWLLGSAVFVWIVLALAYLGVSARATRLGLSATYWKSSDWSGAAALTRTVAAVRTDRARLRLRLGESHAYSAVWTATLYSPRAEEVLFTVTSDDGSWVEVDGTTVIDNGGLHGPTTQQQRLPLSRGSHALTIRYFDGGGDGMIDFSWQRSSPLARLLPPGVLYPSAVPPERARAGWIVALTRATLGWALAALGTAVLLASATLLGVHRHAGLLLASLAFAAGLAAYGVEILAKRSTAVAACDTYAYLQGATLMAEQGPLHTQLHDPLVPAIVDAYKVRPPDRDIAFLLSPHGHYVHDFARGFSYNVFPPGLMWLLAPFVVAGGAAWALLVLPVLTLVLACTFFVLASRHVNAWFALCATALLIGNPVVFENTVLLMSDVPSMALTSASVYLLFVNLSKRHAALPVLAGACMGAAVTIRYSNAAALVPVLLIFALQWARHRDRPALVRDLSSFGALTLLVGILPLALYTHRLFGTLLRMTYDPYTASHMSVAHLGPNMGFYASSMVHSFGAPALAIIATGLVTCLVRKERRAIALVGLMTIAAFLLPYSFERLREHRYLMPVYPFLALFFAYGALAISGLLRRPAALRRVAVLVLAALPLLAARSTLPSGAFTEERTARVVGERVEREAVVFCDHLSGPVRLYAGLTSYRFVWTRHETLAETCEILHRLGRPVYFLLDSDVAREHFQRLRDRGILGDDRLALAAEPDGFPLWQHRPPPPRAP